MASWRRLGAILKRLGAILGRLGRILEGFWVVLEAFWDHFGSIFGEFSNHLDQYAKIAKNLGKPMVFHRFSRFWDGSRVRKIQKIDENWLKEAKRRQK